MKDRTGVFTLVRQLLFGLAVGFIIGVGFSSAGSWAGGFTGPVIGLAVALTLIYFVRGRQFNLYIFSAVILFGFVFGTLRFNWEAQNDLSLVDKLGQKVVVTGVIVESPDERDTTTRLVVKVSESSAKILVSTQPYKEFAYGDLVKATGTLTEPANFTTDAGREFDYVSYLKVRGIEYEISFAQTEILGHDKANPLLAQLFKVKRLFIEKLNLVLPEPQASLLAGLLVGERRGLGTDLTTDFRRAGLVHIVVLSGYNMTIVAEALMIFLAYFLSFNLTLLAGAGSILLFALMVGGGPTVLRASLMALLAIWARATGRSYEATRGLFLAGVVMLVHNPLILAYDTGFQLSFLATLGLIYLSAPIEAKLKWLTEKFGLRGIVSSTLAAQLAVLPWLFYKIGEVSLVALPANILVVPFIPLTMLAGFVAGISGFLSYYLSFVFGVLTHFMLSYELFIVAMASHLPLASVSVPQVSMFLVLLFYLPLIWWGVGYKKETLSTDNIQNDLKPF